MRNRLQTRKIGRNGQGQFWCGFCQALVRVGSEGLDAWQERFDHIDFQHFARGQRIDDWLPPKGMLTKGERQKALEEGLLLLDPETVDNITSDVNNDTRRLYNSLDNNGSTNRNQALEPVKEARLVSRHASPLAPTDYFEAGSTVSPNPARRARMSRGNASQAATRSANTLSPQGIFRPSAPNAAQRQAIADDLISFTVPERKPDPHEDVDQCVIECVSSSYLHPQGQLC